MEVPDVILISWGGRWGVGTAVQKEEEDLKYYPRYYSERGLKWTLGVYGSDIVIIGKI